MLRKVLFGIVVAALALLLAEGALRAFLPVERLLFEWERPAGLLAFTESGSPVTRPDMNEDRLDGPYTWHVALNDLGLREDAPVAPGRPADTYRILALGDSWIFGFSVTQGRTIADQLEALLPARLGVAKVEVLNAGVFGSCAFDMLKRYRQFADAWEIDGVLLGQPHNGARQSRVAEERTRWYSLIPAAPKSRMRLYLAMRRAIASMRTPRYAQPPAGAQLEAEVADLMTLAAEAGERGHRVWFAELPNDLNVALNPGFTPSAQWRAGMDAAGVPYGGHALDARACWGFTDRGHPSEAGARVIAETLADVIATGRSVPDVRHAPRCDDVAEAGPGKPGWAWVD